MTVPPPERWRNGGESLYRTVLQRIRRDGVLLFSDARLPSVATLVAQGPIRGSWFAHPAGATIFHIGERLEERADLLVLPLILQKMTVVWRPLWSSILTVAVAHEAWQTRGLPLGARRMLEQVEALGRSTVPELGAVPVPPRLRREDLARDLERRLLVRGISVHSETGRHIKLLESWSHWSRGKGVRLAHDTPAQARSRLETAARTSLGAGAPERLFRWDRP